MSDFIIFLLLTAAAVAGLVFVTRKYGVGDERDRPPPALKPRVVGSRTEARSGEDRRAGKDRRQSVRYEPQGNPRRAGSRRRSYEELLRRSAELSVDRSRDTSMSRPPYPG